MDENKQPQEQQGGDKTAKKFAEAEAIFFGTLGEAGKDLPKKLRASTDLVDKVVAKMAGEKEKKFEEELERKIQTAIDGWHAYQEERSVKFKEFEKADEAAMKRFIESAKGIAQSIKDQGEIRKRYCQGAQAFKQASAPDTSAPDDSVESGNAV